MRTTLAVIGLIVIMSGGTARTASAQPRSERHLLGQVTDTAGRAVPWALVLLDDKLPAVVADDSGRFRLRLGARQRATLEVRRIGFRPERFEIAFGADTLVQLAVRLIPVATVLEAQEVRAVATLRTLEVAGFYERLRDRKLGAGSGTFITPEEIELRQPRQITQMLDGVPGVMVVRHRLGRGGTPVGRGRSCPMTVYLDGVRLQLAGTSVNEGAPGSMLQMMRGDLADTGGPTLDEMVGANDVAAIEVYPRGVNAPPQFQMTNGTCGIIAIWTGGRRLRDAGTP